MLRTLYTLRKILTSILSWYCIQIDRKGTITIGKRPGAKYSALKRLDSLMADGEKRSEAKAAARLRGESTMAFSDNRIHAFESRNNYQKIAMRFINWCRDERNLRDLERQIEPRADELASLYLSERVMKGYSAWTLKTERSALRMFFQRRDLAKDVLLPKRRRENIVRSRYPAKRDAFFNADNWSELVNFSLACGLRREELRDLLVKDVYYRPSDNQLVVRVVRGKGGKNRMVSAFPGREQALLAVTQDRRPDEHVFTRLPSAMDIQSYRRRFAQELYEYLSGKPLPPQQGRLHGADFDKEVALYVSRQLGHNRIDVIFSNYIR